MRPLAALFLAILPVSACSGSDTSTPAPPRDGGTTDAVSPTAGGDAGGSTSAADGGEAGAAAGDIPAGDPAALNAWLQKKPYLSWPHESAPHPSTGPHTSDAVLTYVDPKLDASMKAGNAEHPVGAAAVKEFITKGQLSGWAAYVKTQPKSDGGKGWYWYEVFGVQPGASTIAGQGHTTCTGCHAGGKDFVLTPYPLR
jgi:hypothetical protein